jgi:hypothetical protein
MPKSRIPDSHARFSGYRSFLENEEGSEFLVPRLSVPFSSALYCVCIESHEPRSEYRISKSEYTRFMHLPNHAHKNFNRRPNRIWLRGSDRGVKSVSIHVRILGTHEKGGEKKRRRRRKRKEKGKEKRKGKGTFHESES